MTCLYQPPTQEMEQEYYMEAPPVLPSPPGPHVLPHHPIEPPSHFYPSRVRSPIITYIYLILPPSLPFFLAS